MLLALAAVAAVRIVDLLVLAIGAVVIAVLLHALADQLARRTPLSGGWALFAILLGIAAILVTVAWLFGTQIQAQFSQLAETLPSAWESLKERVSSLPAGEQILKSLEQPATGRREVLLRLSGFVASVGTVVTDLLLLLFGAIFIAANPGLYRSGIIKLIPKKQREPVEEALTETDRALRMWMLGQLVSMALVGLLTGLGLWLVGVPSSVALGIIAGIAEIIPWAGPIIASVPILVVALAEGSQTALLALVVLIAVQQIESNLLMPYVQKRAVALPPALTVFGVVAGGLLFGPVGLIFAAPMLVISYVLVKRLYVRGALETPTRVPGER